MPPRYESALTEILIALAAIDEDGVFPLDAPRLLTLGEGLAREIPGAADEGEKLLRYLEALEAA